MSGDEQTPEDPKPSEKPSMPESGSAKPAKSVFSDSFDNPHYGQEKDELPDDEPLTPELVEEEAIRGDFMLRWAAVFLAVLMAFGKLNDTKPLVLIRSGDVMRANGFLPPAKDEFSHTLADQPVGNVSWLFDHVVSLSWLVAGEKGLTLLKVLVAGLSAFLLLRISIPGVSSWWSSICMVFAIIACSQDFMPIPDLATILGMTLTMRFLFQHRIGTSSGLTWKLPLLIAVWCNFDTRAWVGVGVILAFSFGTSLARSLARKKETNAVLPGSLMGPAVLSVFALLINPFHIASLLSPIAVYSTEYPAMQEQRKLSSSLAAVSFDQRVDWFPTYYPSAIQLFDHTHVAGIAILLVAFVVLLLSRSARDMGFLFALAFAFGLILLAAHELPAASIVAAVVASVAAQDWYRRSFNMKYSTDSKELLFSRGGRAATVLALALLGFCVVAARLPGSTPLGFGFDRETQVTIDTLAEQIQSMPEDARFLHTRIEQGDILIWNGRKSFVDSRVLPFGRPEEPTSVFGQHRNVLTSLMQPPPEEAPTSDPVEKENRATAQANSIAAARKTLMTYDISHIMTRLAPPGIPDYVSMQNLAASQEWLPISIGASAAILERITPTMTQLQANRKVVRFEPMAFQSEDSAPPSLRQFVGPANFYDKYLYRTRPFTDANKRLATHYLKFSEAEPQSTPEALSAIAKLTLAIRNLNLSLSANPDDDEALVMLGQSYMQLNHIEQLISGRDASQRLRQLRQIQGLCVFRQASKINPANKLAWDGLFSVYQQMNRVDFAQEALEKWLELADQQSGATRTPQFEEFLAMRYKQKTELEEKLEDSEIKVADAIKQRIDQMKEADLQAGNVQDSTSLQAADIRNLILTASMWQSGGYHRKALQTLQDNLPLAQASLFGRFLLGDLLLQTGELEEAHRTLSGLTQDAMQRPEDLPNVEWQFPVAASQVAVCDFDSAGDTWKAEQLLITKTLADSPIYSTVAFTLPLMADANLMVNEKLPVWPFHNANAIGTLASNQNEILAELTLLNALIHLEQGSNSTGKELLAKVVGGFGETRSRPLAMAYYSMVDDKAIELFQQFAVDIAEEFQYPGEIFPEPPQEGSSPPSTQQGGEATEVPAQ